MAFASYKNIADKWSVFLVGSRTRITQVLGLLIFVLLFMQKPFVNQSGWLMSAVMALGVFSIVFGILGRLWCVSYIGGVKSRELQSQGPYSLVRHPLYVCNFLLGLGYAFLTRRFFVWGIVLIFFIIQYTVTIRHEERVLSKEFGESYTSYKKMIPCIIPRWTLFDSTFPCQISRPIFWKELSQSFFFLLLIPLVWVI